MRLKNKLLMAMTLCMAFSPSIFAYAHPGYYASKKNSGFYIGGQLGGCDLHYNSDDFKSAQISSIKDQGLGGRLALGYDLNSNVGFECGVTLYESPEFKINQGETLRFDQSSLDLLGKLSLPVTSNLKFYTKGGVSFVHRENLELSSKGVAIKVENLSDDRIQPILGVGISYAFNPRLSGDLGYFRTFGSQDSKAIDFYAVGFTIRLG